MPTLVDSDSAAVEVVDVVVVVVVMPREEEVNDEKADADPMVQDKSRMTNTNARRSIIVSMSTARCYVCTFQLLV